MSNKDNDSINNANRFDDEIFVALFRKGVHEYLENDLLADLPEKKSDTALGLSEFTEKKIKKNIKQAIRRENSIRIVKRLPKAVVIVLTVLVICTITVMSVEAFRVPFLNLFINTEEKITTIDFDEEQTNSDNSIAGLFGYIPQGFELTTEDSLEQGMIYNYTNEGEDNILIEIYSEEGSSGIDTESAEFSEIMINGIYQGFYSTKNGETTLVFTKDGYTYFISASMDVSEIIKIAENIK